MCSFASLQVPNLRSLRREGIAHATKVRAGSGSVLMDVKFSELGLKGQVAVRDLWKQKDMGVFGGGYNHVEVPSPGVVMLKLTPQSVEDTMVEYL